VAEWGATFGPPLPVRPTQDDGTNVPHVGEVPT